MRFFELPPQLDTGNCYVKRLCFLSDLIKLPWRARRETTCSQPEKISSQPVGHNLRFLGPKKPKPSTLNQVKSVTEAKVLESEAYVLFYCAVGRASL